ncbi:MAG: 3-phosphoshikimate 1-carboxyvinyltransferase [Desulfobacterales bacterium]|nr:3-phosphoshikimate 1-carboxyvinyltransferase [Desulfobacterales bacterium]
MIEIKTQQIDNRSVIIPGSKSYTHRILIGSALSDGVCKISNALKSEDTLLTFSALKQFGINAEETSDGFTITGEKGSLKSAPEAIFMGNSGTSIRLLTGVAALGQGEYILTGTTRMFERPIQDLLDGLNQVGIAACSTKGNGCPPVSLVAGNRKGGHVDLKCKISSQYLSSLLLIAPCLEEGLEIDIIEGPVSKPYIDMTIDVMERLGIETSREGYEHFNIPGNQIYNAGNYNVESDCSNASYFWAAGAITGAEITVKGISAETQQGDIRFVDVLEQMGAQVKKDDSGITVFGNNLKAIDVDMSDMPDIVPTLGVVAAFAEGTTTIRNVAHLKAKECDRLSAVATELGKMGIDVTCTDDGLIIKGGKPHGAEIETYNDHRIAMCFSIAGLKVPGVVITGENCVEKSFPTYWDVFSTLY